MKYKLGALIMVVALLLATAAATLADSGRLQRVCISTSPDVSRMPAAIATAAGYVPIFLSL